MKTRTIKNPNLAGFTLIEVMITVAVIAILAAVALPQYFDYVTRSRLVEAKASLADMRTRMEQFFLDNRRFPAPDCAAVLPATSLKFFNISCVASEPPANTYTVTATGKDSMAGFVFTIDQANTRATTSTGSWNKSSAVCWISRKSGEC